MTTSEARSEARPSGGRWSAAFASLAAGVALVALGAAGALDAPLIAVAAHAGVAIALVGCAEVVRRFGGDPTLTWHAAAWTLVLGPFGAAIAAAVAVLAAPRAATGIAPIQALVDEALAEPATRARPAELRRALRDNRLRISGAAAAVSFRDVFAGSDQGAKLNALSVLARAYGPEFAPALRMAMVDDDAAVRVLAAGVLARLQEQFANRISALEDAAQRTPNDVAAQRALAAEHRAFANSGLLTPERRIAALERSRAALAAALALSGEVAPLAEDLADLDRTLSINAGRAA